LGLQPITVPGAAPACTKHLFHEHIHILPVLRTPHCCTGSAFLGPWPFGRRNCRPSLSTRQEILQPAFHPCEGEYFTVSLPSVLSHFLAQSSFPCPIASFQLVSGRLGDPSLKHVLRWCSLHYRYSSPAWCGRSPTTSWTRMTAPCGICSRIRCAWGSTSHIWWQPSRGAFSSNATATSRNISVAMLASIRFGVNSLGPQIMKISVPIVCTTTTTTF